MTISVRPRPRTTHLYAPPSRPSSVRSMPPVPPTLQRSPMAPAEPCLRRAGRFFFHPHTSAQNCHCIGCSSCRSIAAIAAFLGPFESVGTPRSPCVLAAAHCLLSVVFPTVRRSVAQHLRCRLLHANPNFLNVIPLSLIMLMAARVIIMVAHSASMPFGTPSHSAHAGRRAPLLYGLGEYECSPMAESSTHYADFLWGAIFLRDFLRGHGLCTFATASSSPSQKAH